MKNKTSNAERVSEKAECLKSHVMALLQWDEQTYGNFKFEQGLQYAESYLMSVNPAVMYYNSNCPEMPRVEKAVESIKAYTKMLTHSRIYWQWFKNHWSLRDQSLCDDLKNGNITDVHVLREIYFEVHNINILTNTLHPNRVLLEETYTEMITQLIEEEVNK